VRDRGGKDARADMAMTWTKIKLWTKVSVFGVVAIYLIAFILVNRNAEIDPALDFLFKKHARPNALLVLLLTAIFSVFSWWLFKTVFKTLRQMREVKRRAHLERIEREHADMVAKAAKLQTRPGAGDAA
jgi:hypothetical protein